MNPHLEKRLRAILEQLHAVHGGGADSTATRGAEREAFVELLLRGCLPSPYRFGSGEVTDAHGTISGQIDVVIENPFFPSFPLLGTSQHRLYHIEGVAIAIEVKSGSGQFGEAVEAMRKYRTLVSAADWPEDAPPRRFGGATGSGVPTSFPGRDGFAIVTYDGFAKASTLIERCAKDDVDVALQFNPAIFHARNFRETGQPKTAEGAAALAGFLYVVNDELCSLVGHTSNLFRRYVERVPAPDVGADS